MPLAVLKGAATNRPAHALTTHCQPALASDWDRPRRELYTSGSKSQVLITDLEQSLTPEALFVAAVDDPHRQFTKSSHCRDVCIDVRTVELVEQGAVVDRVSRKEDPRRPLPQSDAPRRMSGQVQDFKTAVSEVDDVAVVERARRSNGVTLEVQRFQSPDRHRVDKQVGNLVASAPVGAEHRLAEGGGLEAYPHRFGELVDL